MAAEKAEMDALKKECDGLRAQIEVSGPNVRFFPSERIFSETLFFYTTATF